MRTRSKVKESQSNDSTVNKIGDSATKNVAALDKSADGSNKNKRHEDVKRVESKYFSSKKGAQETQQHNLANNVSEPILDKKRAQPLTTGATNKQRNGRSSVKRRASSDHSDSDCSIESDYDVDDWQNVGELDDDNFDDACDSQASSDVCITVSISKNKKQAKQLSEEALFRRQLNKYQKERQQNIHKTQILCNIYRIRRLSQVCNSALLKSLLLSMLPIGYCKFSDDIDKKFILRFVKWFNSAFCGANIRSSTFADNTPLDNMISLFQCGIVTKQAANQLMLVMFFVTCCRALGCQCRLISALDLLPWQSKTLSTSSKKDTAKHSELNLSNGKILKRPKKSDDALLSDESQQRMQKYCLLFWAEIYCDSEKRWLSVDVVDRVVDDPDSVRQASIDPLAYVFACDIDLSVKDVTARYASESYVIDMRKVKAPTEWLQQSLRPFRSRLNRRSNEEDVELHNRLIGLPLPKTLNHFKCHPLYCLRRDILKFEAVYPPDVQPIAIIRNEPVYERKYIRKLHGKETWIKTGRSVKPKEVPYKQVNGRPKSHIPKELQVERTVDLYGFWQTEIYRPPVAQDGIVPRNEYNNVYLFKDWMLPVGCVHMQIPNLLHIAKRLNIDCAPAHTGWDFHARGNHPIFEGWVVCAEFEEKLLDEWDKEQAVSAVSLLQKRKQRALKNWRRLTRGLLLREQLQRKYQQPTISSSSIQDDNNDCAAWPRNRIQLEM